MNPVEQILLNFAKNELANNPQLAGKFLQHLLEQHKVDPSIAADAMTLVTQLLPIIIQAIK